MRLTSKKELPAYIYILILTLFAIAIFAYWGRNDQAEFITEIGGIMIAVPLSVAFYSLASFFRKKGVSLPSGLLGKYISNYSWVVPIGIFLICAFYIFPHTKHLLLNDYGISEPAYVTDHYFTYGVAPIGFNFLFAGSQKTDEFSATTEVVKYRTMNSHREGTIDFPYNAYAQTSESLLNKRIRQNKTIQIKYLRFLTFIAEPAMKTN